MLYNRKPNRLKEYDYSEPGYYFITICTKERIKIFGEITGTESRVNRFGRIVEKNIKNIERIYNFIEIDEYIIMPDHIHLILILDGNKDKTDDRKKMVLSKVIQQFKRQCTIEFRAVGFKKELWQRSFYDRIIRSEKELYYIKNYIRNNPLTFEIEKGFPENLEL